RLHAVLGYHAAHRGAETLVIVLLPHESFLMADVEEGGDVVADALINLLPEIEVVRIKGIVEIEHPRIDAAEIAQRPRQFVGLLQRIDLKSRLGGIVLHGFKGTVAEPLPSKGTVAKP